MSEAKANVLIIDDEKSICIGIADLLDSYGYPTQYAQSVEQGLQLLETNRDIDIVLLDIDLGSGLSGDEAIGIIKDRFKYVQIVMLTSHSSIDNAVDCMKNGASDFLTKPFNEEIFFGIVPNALETKKLAQLSDLYLGILVHDLKNPLHNVTLSLDYIKHTALDKLNAKQQRLLSVVNTNLWEINNMIGNILNVGKIEQGGIKPSRDEIVLKREVETSLEILKTRASISEKNLDIAYHTPDDFVFVGDQGLFSQVLSNLVSNAMRFCPQGETVEINFNKNSSGELQVSVKNPGSFIREEAREEVFSKFFSAQKENKYKANRNFGLGLTFSHMAVEVMGGKIWVEGRETPPETTFHFTLPLRKEPGHALN